MQRGSGDQRRRRESLKRSRAHLTGTPPGAELTSEPTAAQQCNFVTPLQLYFTWRTAIENGQVRSPRPTVHLSCCFATDLYRHSSCTRKLTLLRQRSQIWRLATCFLYWGPLSLDFFFHLFFL